MGATSYDQVARVTTEYSDSTGLVDLQDVNIFNANGTVASDLRYLYNYCPATSSGGAEALLRLTVNGEVYEYDYDSLGRLIKRRTSIDAEDETVRPTIQVNYGKYEEYTYVAGAASGTTTTLVKTFRDMILSKNDCSIICGCVVDGK